MIDLEAALATVSAHADAGESARQITPEVVHALTAAGAMRLLVPAEYGGPEQDPEQMVDTIEAIAAADGAAGWCAMISSTTSLLSWYLPEAWAGKIYGDPRGVTGGTYAPLGTADAVDGGWRVTGRWQWGSGTRYCTWITGGTLTPDGGFHLMFLDPADVTFHDTWDSVGMRGSGSGDFSVDDAFVPAGRSVQPFLDAPALPGALGRFPLFSLLCAGVGAVGIGVARHALREFVVLAGGKKPQYSVRTLAASGAVQLEVGRARAAIDSAHWYLVGELRDAWAAAQRGETASIDVRARLRLAAVNAADVSARVVDTLFTWAGGTAVFVTSPLQRCLRDAHVVTQHIMTSPRSYETVGKITLGIDADTSML